MNVEPSRSANGSTTIGYPRTEATLRQSSRYEMQHGPEGDNLSQRLRQRMAYVHRMSLLLP